VRLSVHKPALWAAVLFLSALRARGIEVEGEARSRDARSRSEKEFSPESAVELASIESRTLGEIARATNKESLNLEAELILRTLGRERGAEAPDPDPIKMRIRGDDQAGLAVIRKWLEGAGVSTSALALHDGSGLSRLNLVTAEATSRLLAQIARNSSAKIFRDTLPVAGRDGTLSYRLRRAAGQIQAKTGTLTYTNSLSGYATTADGEHLAFSIICNDETTPANSTIVIDAIASLLADYRKR
jgi:D-alanyl-D-alanine carboxypeptidase/D-alanyl-D-alanine-endopeptidase (penicillin-binding protein 4)